MSVPNKNEVHHRQCKVTEGEVETQGESVSEEKSLLISVYRQTSYAKQVNERLESVKLKL